ncbi:transcriptional regulator GlxA family with amidase domain [Rhizobium mesoamericanum]|uniref:GlxA family transcriptional regulator n=1 Tax=Rhizobium mesoamericanum TaxID=1079800 RepID=UPI0027880150|nr:GlxA family transcriptional regulator [Rhizobium mesoamericanum]MDQ0562671.1 transcriptional regulator GlxA family with amidase domain [Rhizobium mesoamericanum]
MSLSCGFLIFDGFSNMVLASAIEPLRAARDYAGPNTFAWRLLSPEGTDVRSSSGLLLRCDGDLEDARDLDILFIVAGYGARQHAQSSVLKRLQRLSRSIGIVGGLDCGAWLLAQAGLLTGYRATIHWQDLSQFSEVHLDVEVTSDRFVIDRNRITAGGATTVVDLMLKLIGDHGGGALAFDVSNMFVYDARLRVPDERGARSLSLATRVPQLLKAVAHMRAHVESPLSLEAISHAAATSPRTLARLFQRELGMGPGHYYQSIRLDVARSLAEETSLAAHEIAARTGFASAASLSRAFSGHFGSTLRETRRNRLGAPRN